MIETKRVRIFAGPNGSGKSTFFKKFIEKYNSGYFINADEIQLELEKEGRIQLSNFGLENITQNDLLEFKYTDSANSIFKKSNIEENNFTFEISNNDIKNSSNQINSYAASFCASFIRWLLYKQNISFSFETVMSHHSKLAEIKEAMENGYKTYLYFICLDDSLINVERVNERVLNGGHNVETSKIISRYYNTLNNLYPAIKLVNNAYLFDNSGNERHLIAKAKNNTLEILTNELPNWFLKYVVPNYLFK